MNWNRLGVAAPVLVAMALVAACGGRALSLGSDGAKLVAVDSAQVSGAAPACGQGEAHPNVCCTGGPSSAAGCGEWEGAPFHPCDPGANTYPDPRTCCTLTDPPTCAPAPSSTPPNPGPNAGSCTYDCPPGNWHPTNGAPGECCANDSNGGTICSAPASNGGNPPTCVGPNCPPVPQPPPPPVNGCACPDGWQSPAGEPNLCCRTLADNSIECFTPVTGPTPPAPPDPGPGPTPTPVDAGPGPSPRACGGTMPVDGGGGSCGCSESAGGHNYEMNCDDSTTHACVCKIDGVQTATFSRNAPNCSPPTDLGALWTSGCGFP